jgi:nucleoside-diphosphate-sugar epimerase
MSDAQLSEMLVKHEYFIFAAGADDRVVPKAPAYPFFHKANVESVQRILGLAKAAGAKKCVVLNSYFAYFNRIWPEMKLAEKHPYIRSRQAQSEAAFAVAGKEMPVAIMELPYIVGVAPGKTPLWKPLVKYVNTGMQHKFYTSGGTAVVSVRNVAEAVVNSLDRVTENGYFQIADENMSWEKWLSSLRSSETKQVKVIAVPNLILKFATLFVRFKHYCEGRQSGLNATSFIDLQTKNTFLPIEEMKKKLGYGSYSLDEDLIQTVKASLHH